jgi:hypothetical protein
MAAVAPFHGAALPSAAAPAPAPAAAPAPAPPVDPAAGVPEVVEEQRHDSAGNVVLRR